MPLRAPYRPLTLSVFAQADKEEILEMKMEMEAAEKRYEELEEKMKAQFKAVLDSLSAKAHKETVRTLSNRVKTLVSKPIRGRDPFWTKMASRRRAVPSPQFCTQSRWRRPGLPQRQVTSYLPGLSHLSNLPRCPRNASARPFGLGRQLPDSCWRQTMWMHPLSVSQQMTMGRMNLTL